MVESYTLTAKNLFKRISVPLGFVLIFCILSQINFLFFHISIELFCVVTAFILLTIAANTRRIAQNTCFMFLGIAFGFVGFFTALHAITYAGTNIFPGNTSNITIQLRVISAYIQAFSFLFFVSFFDRVLNIRASFYVFLSISGALLLSVFYFNAFPVSYIENIGHTPFKIASELVVCLIFIASIFILIKRRTKLKNIVFHYMLFSMLSMVSSEILYSLYIEMNSPLNIAGHILKFFSFYYIYKSVIETNLNYPYRLLREVNEELSLQKAYFQQLFEGSPEGIVMLDSGDRVLDINKGFEDLFGFSIDEIRGQHINTLIVPENMYGEASNNSSTVLSGRAVHKDTLRKRKDGTLINVHILGYPITFSNKQIGVYGIYSDITDRKRAEEKIMYLSFHDKLTGLYNRAFFEEELKRLDTERQLPISIIMGDLNNLKLANDIFGHDIGDELLVKISDILKDHCRCEDIIARWGGDEFIILLPQTSEDTALSVCDRIKDACSTSEGNPIQPSIALGIATKSGMDQDIKGILSEAEHRMYRNKLIEHKSARSATIDSLEKLLLEKDYETREHTIRIQEVAWKIGHALNFTGSQLDELSLLALLHDIGKIAIPDSILLKLDALSEDEWTIIRKHPEIGYRIAQSSSELSSIAYAILSHHERWDGTGYPQGLEGEKIPFISRIISIADAFDVMTHDRNYRRKMSTKEAVDEISKCSGTQFDPVLVDIFIRVISSDEEEAKKFA